MGSKAKFDRDIANVHIIETHEAFREFLNRAKLRDPASMHRALIRFFREMAQCELEEVTALHIDHTIQRLSSQGYTMQYVRRLGASALAFLAWANALGYISKNVGLSVVLPNPTNYFMPVEVDVEYTRKLRKYVVKSGDVNDIILVGSMLAGARLSEPCTAVIRDVSLDEEARVPFVWFGTKTTHRRAQLPEWAFDAVVAATLGASGVDNALLLEFEGTPKYWNPEWDTPGFANVRKQVMTARSDRARIRLEQLQMACIREKVFTPKDLRSTIITRNIRANPNGIVDLARQVGSSVDMITRKYLNNTRVLAFETE